MRSSFKSMDGRNRLKDSIVNTGHRPRHLWEVGGTVFHRQIYDQAEYERGPRARVGW